MPSILLTGVSGYVGSHVLEYLNQTYSSYIVYATYCSRKPVFESNDASKQINYIKLDLSDDKSIEKSVNNIFSNDIIPEIIIHCAAMPSLGVCPKNKAKAEKVNCPTVFVQALLSQFEKHQEENALFIYLSTDHVYDGKQSSSMHKEEEESKETNVYNEQSPTYPINVYGQTKLDMESYLLLHWDNLVILRCSVIYGPQNQNKSTLLQFVVDSLRDNKQKEVILFKNEKRNFVFIESVIQSIGYFVKNSETYYHEIYNCGGIDTMSRVEFGMKCGKYFGLGVEKINAMNRYDCKQKWAHSAPNPEDTSMDSSKLYTELKDFYAFPSFMETLKSVKENQDKKWEIVNAVVENIDDILKEQSKLFSTHILHLQHWFFLICDS